MTLLATPTVKQGRWRQYAILALAAVASLCFAGALFGPFILDDGPLIAQNPSVHGFSHLREWFAKDFWDVDIAQAQLGGRLHYFRPLVLASYALDWVLGGGSPWLLHATNVGLHALVACLAFLTLERWIGVTLPGLFGALLFAVHPTKAESVSWISGRPDVLLTLAVLLACWGMARRLRAQRGGLAVEACATLLAYLSKEHAVVLPALAFVESWVADGRPALQVASVRRGLRAALPQLGVALAYLAARHVFLPLRPFAISGLSFGKHVAFVLETLGRNAVLALWPADLSLTQAMIRTGPSGAMPTSSYVLTGVVTLVVIVAIAVYARRRHPAQALAALLWLGLLAPISNLMWNGLPNLTSPRFSYLPMLALAWASGELVASAEWPARIWPHYAAALLGMVLAARSVARSLDFASATTFWNRELSSHPSYPLGYAFALQYELRHGRPHQALQVAAHGFALSAAHFPNDAQRSQLVLEAVRLTALLTPDLRRGVLEQLDAFIAALEGSGPARLETAELVLDLPPGSAVRGDLTASYPELLLVRADLATRLGDDHRAMTLASRALAGCARCAAQWDDAARVALRAGELGVARKWLAGPRNRSWDEVPEPLRRLYAETRALDDQIAHSEGPLQVQLQAQRNLMLGLPGRAYARLLPYRDAIVGAGTGPRQSFAEVALRAGAIKEARALISNPLAGGPGAPLVPSEDSERLLKAWSEETPWNDAPLGADEDIAFEQTVRHLTEAHE